jgi:branched-chain amino acid transport system substrate-binding protein
MSVSHKFSAIALAIAAASNCIAAEPLKIGLILPMSGTFSSYGKQIENGVKLYLQQNGDTISGRKVQIIVKDDTGAAPEISKRLAQELVVRDKVDILAGFAMTPAAFAVAPIATEAKKPMVVMNAGTSNLTTKSPYIVRTSATVAQYTMPLGTWTARNNMKKAFTVVADFGPGHDAENYFKKSYVEAGGQVIGELRVPLKNPDFAPFLQKIKDAKPDVVFVFLPAGELPIAFLKGFKERNLAGEGIKIVATGDLSDDDSIDAIGDVALGVVSAHQYSEAHKSPENKVYTDAYYKAYPNTRPNFMSVGGYDGMRLIAETLKQTNGDATGDKFMAAVKGTKFVSPRGPISIDPDTRDIVETIYMRKVERVGSKLMNVEFDDSFKNYKDPGKTDLKQ